MGVCEEFCRSQVTVTSLAWLRESERAGALSRDRAQSVSLYVQDIFVCVFVVGVVFVVLRAWPGGEQRHTTAPLLLSSAGPASPARRGTERSSQLISRSVCTLLAVVKAQPPTATRHQSHLSCPRPPPSLPYRGSFLSALAWQAFGLSPQTTWHLPVAAAAALPEEPVIGVRANQCVWVCVFAGVWMATLIFRRRPDRTCMNAVCKLPTTCTNNDRLFTIGTAVSFVDVVLNYLLDCSNEAHYLLYAIIISSESVKKIEEKNQPPYIMADAICLPLINASLWSHIHSLITDTRTVVSGEAENL